MSQTAYTQNPAVAVEGLPFDISENTDIVSAIASTAISFGHAVARIASTSVDDRPPVVRLTQAAGDLAGIFVGITCNDVTLEQTGTGYIIKSVMRVMREGRIWVLAEDAVTYGGAVFARITAGVAPLDQLGALRSDADGGNATQIPGATWVSTTTGAGQLAVVELRP